MTTFEALRRPVWFFTEENGRLPRGAPLLLLATISAGWFMFPGLQALFRAWQLPEYSHGPLIPVISCALFLRHLKLCPNGPVESVRAWPGLAILTFSVLLGLAGRLARIDEIVAYALIFWFGGALLIVCGWQRGRRFWPSILHLVFMLPLPGLLYYKLSAALQLLSSEIGVAMLRAGGISVFLDGNVIDLGHLQLHVAEACSGLRYLFPILSFSYVFALLHRGPGWQRVVLLLSAAPITIALNALRIAIAGAFVQMRGAVPAEGFLHFFEGWIIFLASVVLLFLLSTLLSRVAGPPVPFGLSGHDAVSQLARLRDIRATRSLVLAAILPFVAGLSLASMPQSGAQEVDRVSFALFPTKIGAWEAGTPERFPSEIERTLGADDYHKVVLNRPGTRAPVRFFSAWYADQSAGGVHSPEICLPGAGWEIAALRRIDISARVGSSKPFRVNRAVVQKGSRRQLVFYWFDQKGRKLAWDYAAKAWLLLDGVRTGRTDGALVELTTPILPGETEAVAEERLLGVIAGLVPVLPRFLSAAE
ncbi:VPLPA-CTERM-specific exosortase XrtD [Tropicimonas sp. TH_r6]|uniref:VPLPA-CTERM-specific exosortase XrtD n=1 Tax=Tropicimonas sp. TH_r6 TaxID=3082085 RepID=UPI0029545541|nr:VPLPA-CTERM-specific exosortase XrtD [Tropicimonas sp. TH_r6]MDV7141182.1 VPLPA-CTERM-specific exosortase XrtD [Tropicimonas sp. TH_r6]